eukprot:357892-Chlamydomonas_euryale.AAC.5
MDGNWQAAEVWKGNRRQRKYGRATGGSISVEGLREPALRVDATLTAGKEAKGRRQKKRRRKKRRQRGRRQKGRRQKGRRQTGAKGNGA